MQQTVRAELGPSQDLTIAENKIPMSIVVVVFAVCIIPSIANLLGVDFSSPGQDAEQLLASSPGQLNDNAHAYLKGSLTHTLLEWSAFCAAAFTVVLALAHYKMTRDVVTPIIGIALFSAGTMDAFHTLAANRLIESVADNTDLIPFTWALCRVFNAMIMLIGVAILLNRSSAIKSMNLIVIVSILFGLSAYGLIHWAATSADLPQTMYPDSLITRPFDVLPLVMFLVAGLYVYPKMHKHSPSLFTHALIISAVPEVVVEIHMAFGSSELFDNHFNIAHFLKIFAYVVPFIGLCLDYIRTYKVQRDTSKSLNLARIELDDYASSLEMQVERRTSELKDKQQQLIHAEKLASVGQLAAGVAHEINNPTSFVMGNLEVLIEYKESMRAILASYACLEARVEQLDDEQLTAMLNQIRVVKAEQNLDYIINDVDSLLAESLSGTRRIQKIVEDLKNYSRIDSKEMLKVDLNEDVIETAIRMVANEIKYKCHLSKRLGSLPLYYGRPGELSQVVVNLLVNASDAIADNREGSDEGTITVTSECVENLIIISVADTGSGIEEKDLLKIFDPFFTTKEIGKGTGLGLSISQGIIENHGGLLTVESSLGRGTVFSLQLPIISKGETEL